MNAPAKGGGNKQGIKIKMEIQVWVLLNAIVRPSDHLTLFSRIRNFMPGERRLMLGTGTGTGSGMSFKSCLLV